MLYSQEHDSKEDMAEAPTVTKPTLPSLPTEILQDIAELVSDACGRAGLARASRRLCEVANPTLWRHGVQDNLSKMLVQASTTGNLHILKKSVIYGAYIDVVHPVPIPEEAKKCYPVPFLREEEKDFLFWATPLHLAVYHGHYDAAKWLVSHGADIEAPGHLFCKCKGYRDYLDGDSNISISSCWTPLHYSICREENSIIRLLLSAGASVQTMVSSDKIRISDNFDKRLQGFGLQVLRSKCTSLSSNVTALHTASEKGMKWLVTHLVRNMQVDVDVTDNSSMTPLFYALLSTDPSMIDNLVWLGADLRWKGLDGRTPLKLAFHCNLWQSAARLQDLGAKLDTDTRRPWSDLVCYIKPSKFGSIHLPGLPEERVHLLCHEKEDIKHEAITRLAHRLRDDCLLMKKAGCEAGINRTSEDLGASAALPEINYLAEAFMAIIEENWCGTKILESFLAMGVELDKDDLAWHADGGMTLGFRALKAVTGRNYSPYKIRFLLQNGADPTDKWRHNAHAETPLRNILYAIHDCILSGVEHACETRSFQTIIEVANEFGRYGAWDSPSAKERAKLFGILENIEEASGLSSRQLRLRKQLRDNLIVPYHSKELQQTSTWSPRST
ncbi:Putative ankyrin repeat-containing domain superfamily [Colletotrichum destructivum]|uniref:Ankyrin repeat-containing domain superfamily n=1 Tax=Colletotrichum destructivum TaxID=34406 RepID=A0AAX4IMJ1_9PEZI|nr:Putative ankyrin repeat-containing domain superfamily [Colletotrichum destructivum]